MRAVINFYLTWKCNFYCAHCIHECGPAVERHMTTEQFNYGFNLIKWLSENEIKTCVIGTTGGEPTIHPTFWTEYMPQLAHARQSNNIEYFELHSNASIPIPEVHRKGFHRFFHKTYVGHDPFHRQYKKLNELYLQDHSEISQEVVIRYCNYYLGGYQDASYVRRKGRALESINNGRFIEHRVQNCPATDCSWVKYPPTDTVHFCFTPDHVNHCGEKSHIYSDADKTSSGQFHPYGMDYNKLLHSAFDYNLKFAKEKCSQKCMATWVTLNPNRGNDDSQVENTDKPLLKVL